MGDMNCEGCDYKDECQELPNCIIDAYYKGKEDENESLKRAFMKIYNNKEAWMWVSLEARLGGNND